MQFKESHRSALTRIFKGMTAHSMSWDILWEVCLELQGDSVANAMDFMDGSVEPFEAISITSALRKAGFNHTIRSWKDVE
jgi:hypothetical protein